MNLTKPSNENLEFILTDLKARLNIANTSLIKPDDFRLDDYGEVLDIYEMVTKRPQLSMMQIEGVLAELGELRKRK